MPKKDAIINQVFDYSQLTKDEKGQLECVEKGLLKIRGSVAQAAIKYGEWLAQGQEVLSAHKTGTFVAWVESAAVGVSKQTAYNMIAAYREFSNCPNFGQIELSAMYVLARNPAAKKKAMKLADGGTKITYSIARKLNADTNEPTPARTAAPPQEPEPSRGTDASKDDAGGPERGHVDEELTEASAEPRGRYYSEDVSDSRPVLICEVCHKEFHGEDDVPEACDECDRGGFCRECAAIGCHDCDPAPEDTPSIHPLDQSAVDAFGFAQNRLVVLGMIIDMLNTHERVWASGRLEDGLGE